MLEIDGEFYFVSFDNLDKVMMNGFFSPSGTISESDTKIVYDGENKVISKEVLSKEYYKPREVDMFKYETLRDMIDIVLGGDVAEEESDITNKTDLSKSSSSYKIAFNTLFAYGIIKSVE